MQNYTRLYDYIQDYQDLLYRYYSKHGIAFLTTYYNLEKEQTIWDDQHLMGGAYERIGELSGILWNKIILLPIYFPETISTIFNGDETGYIKELETSATIPSSYGLQPYPGDMIKLDQRYLRQQNDIYPIFHVGGVEKSTDTETTFFKLKLNIEQSRTTEELDNQSNETFVFFDYTKKIYSLENSEILARMMLKMKQTSFSLEQSFDQNSGFYFK